MAETNEALPAWPREHLPLGLLANYRSKPRDFSVATKMEAGLPSSRITSLDVLVDHWFTLRFSLEQEGYFRWWVHNTINRGHGWFKMELRTGGGRAEQPCKFVKLGESRVDGAGFRIAVQVVTRGNPVVNLSEEQINDMLEFGAYELQYIDEQLNKAVE